MTDGKGHLLGGGGGGGGTVPASRVAQDVTAAKMGFCNVSHISAKLARAEAEITRRS